MALSGTYGDIEGVLCSDPEVSDAQIVEEGQISTDIRPFSADDNPRFAEDNCPRQADFDKLKPLGCLGCTYSVISYNDGFEEI